MTRCNGLAIGAEGDGARIPLQNAELQTCRAVPDSHGHVFTAGHDVPTVGLNPTLSHSCCMSLQGEEFLACLGIPNLRQIPYIARMATMRVLSGLNATLSKLLPRVRA
jgi:hypothetical protein